MKKVRDFFRDMGGPGFLYVIAIVSAVGAGVYTTSGMVTLGDAEEDFETVCIGGHEYYRASFLAKGYMANRLNDDGTPVKCQ